MNKKFVGVIATVLLGWWWVGGGDDNELAKSGAPDQELAAHYDGLCKVIRSNVRSPKQGVEKMFAYLGRHSPAMFKLFGDTLVLIERTEDDEAHDKRAKKARNTMQAPLIRCAPHLEKFFGAVEQDPEASALLARGLERLGRTIEIIASGMPESVRTQLNKYSLGKAGKP